jgi:hypothetical protein
MLPTNMLPAEMRPEPTVEASSESTAPALPACHVKFEHPDTQFVA